MEIAIWFAFGWTSEETALKFGPGRDLENLNVVRTRIRSLCFLWSLYMIMTVGLSPTDHNLTKLENHLIPVVIHKGITKQIFGSSKNADFPDRFLIWRSKSTKVTPRKCTESRECTDHSVSKVSAILSLGRLCPRETPWPQNRHSMPVRDEPHYRS